MLDKKDIIIADKREPTGNVYVDENAAAMESYKGRAKYEIVSIFAYLIGVEKRHFENEHEPPRMETYEKLRWNKNARIIRNLCILRNNIEQHYKAIYTAMRDEYKSIVSLPEMVSQEAVTELSNDGIDLYKSGKSLIQYILDINRYISDRINNCKTLFPIWLDWSYIRDLFIMPDGLTEDGAKAAAELYYENKRLYPYQVYMNWYPGDYGNILFNDYRFVKLLYEWNQDAFNDNSKISDVSDYTRYNVFDFLEDSERTVFVVDCENSDAYSLCAMIQNLPEEMLSKIQKVILYDDVHTTSAWQILNEHTSVPVEHIEIERIKDSKSLVDMRLATGVCREFFQNNVESFVLCSSDSDYWALISSLPEAKFLVLVEHYKCGPDIKEALAQSGIFYCYLDEFYTGNSNQDLKIAALLMEIKNYLSASVSLNVNDMLMTAMTNARVNLSPAERNQFYDKYIRQMKLDIDESGNVSLKLNHKQQY